MAHRAARNLNCVSDTEFLADLELFIQLCNRSGVPYRLFRPPFGEISLRQIDLLASRGFDLVQWEVMPRDYEMRTAAAIVQAFDTCASEQCNTINCGVGACEDYDAEGNRLCDWTNSQLCSETFTPDETLVVVVHEHYPWNLEADLVFGKLDALGFKFGDPKLCLLDGAWDFAKCAGHGLGGWGGGCPE